MNPNLGFLKMYMKYKCKQYKWTVAGWVMSYISSQNPHISRPSYKFDLYLAFSFLCFAPPCWQCRDIAPSTCSSRVTPALCSKVMSSACEAHSEKVRCILRGGLCEGPFIGLSDINWGGAEGHSYLSVQLHTAFVNVPFKKKKWLIIKDWSIVVQWVK